MVALGRRKFVFFRYADYCSNFSPPTDDNFINTKCVPKLNKTRLKDMKWKVDFLKAVS